MHPMDNRASDHVVRGTVAGFGRSPRHGSLHPKIPVSKIPKAEQVDSELP